MKLALLALMMVLAAVATFGEPQYYPQYYPMASDYFPSYFRSAGNSPKSPVEPWANRQRPVQQLQSSHASQSSQPPQSLESLSEGRWLFYSAYTLTVSTTTILSTSTVFTTCTTSTTTLSTCTAGRRRRGLFYDESHDRKARGLFYNDDEAAGDTLISESDESAAKVEPVMTQSEQRSPRQIASSTISEEELLKNYKGEWGALLYRDGRFLNIAIATTTSTTTTTRTSSLTAVCASTTSYNVCVNSG